MNRQERHRKAAEIRQAISEMRTELKTASNDRKAELFTDLEVAMDDYEAFMDDGLWGMDEDHQPQQPLQPEVGMEVESVPPELGMAPEFEAGAGCSDFGMEVEELGMLDEAMSLYMDEGHIAGDGKDVPMGAMEEHSNIYAHNRNHVSYILDRVAEVVARIEQYETGAKKAKKASRSGGARKTIATHMKELASVVASSDFGQAETGEALSAVGVKVMAMHKALKAG